MKMTNLANASRCVLRPAGSLLRWTYRSFRRLRPSAPKWQVVHGRFYMRIDPDDWMDRQCRSGAYEPHLVALIAKTVRPNDVCLDIGAQKGYVTLHLAKAVGPGGRVIAFEPDPRAMEVLTANVEYNEFTQVSLIPTALGNSDSECAFMLSGQLGWSSRFPNELAKSAITSTISIPTRRLDDAIAELGIAPETHRLSFIKIDAEGSEPLILQGARETLLRFRPALHIEMNKGSLSAGGFSPESVGSLLRSLGYDLYAVRFRKPRLLSRRRLCLDRIGSLISDLGPCEDILAVHNSSGSVLADPLPATHRNMRTLYTTHTPC